MSSPATPASAFDRRVAWTLTGALVLLAAAIGVQLSRTLEARYERDVSRIVFNDNVAFLEGLRRRAGVEADSQQLLMAQGPQPRANQPYLVVSIEEHRLWYRVGDSVLFTAQVATGSGKVLERTGTDSHWRFETPRGRLTIIAREQDPVWVPPDWHYVEEAQRRGLGIIRLIRGQQIPTGDGGWIEVAGSDVVRRGPDGGHAVLSAAENAELIVGGNIIIPPFGTNQRKYRGVLGTHRLNMEDGYALHGTNKPETIGRSVSHGCVRLRNDDIAMLYELVQVGTPVFIY